MDSLRLKLKVAEHEFEAEGPPSDVHTQFAAFRAMLPPLPGALPAAPANAPDGQDQLRKPAAPDYSTLMRREGDFISLSTRGDTIEDAILLVLLGQKLLRNNERVMGGEILGSLRRSGRVVPRVDYVMSKLAQRGDVVIIGRGRARRYRLTPQGSNNASLKVSS